jgi:type II secretory pathway pseudopilin PulG
MAALLVGMNVMAVLMAMALPVWSHATRREREEELIWRGEQYRRAIMLFQRRYANTFPPSVDVLVEQRFLRKKYKDPITGEDFQVIPVGGGMPGQPGIPPQPGSPTPGMPATRPPGAGFGGAGMAAQPSMRGGSGFGQAMMTPGTQPSMGIQGVTSKSKETSIKLYHGMNRYNQWAFVYLAASSQAGGGAGGFANPGMGGGFGQPGQPVGPGGFGGPAGGFGQPMQPGGFGQPGGGFGQPGGGVGQPGTQPQPKYPPVPGGGSVFTPARPPGA